MHILKQHKYAQIKREELKMSVMERSTDSRLKVEDQSMTKFHSDKIKQNSFFYALRDNPKSLPISTKTTLAKQ